MWDFSAASAYLMYLAVYMGLLAFILETSKSNLVSFQILCKYFPVSHNGQYDTCHGMESRLKLNYFQKTSQNTLSLSTLQATTHFACIKRN